MDRTYECDDEFALEHLVTKHRGELRPKVDAVQMLMLQISTMLRDHDEEMRVLAARRGFRVVQGEGLSPRPLLISSLDSEELLAR